LGQRLRSEDGHSRVLIIGLRPDYTDYVTTAFDQIRSSGAANVAILLRLLQALETVVRRTPNPVRRLVLRQQAELIADAAERHLDTEYEKDHVRRQYTRLHSLLT
jgi:uncharacterized membrane protein